MWSKREFCPPDLIVFLSETRVQGYYEPVTKLTIPKPTLTQKKSDLNLTSVLKLPLHSDNEPWQRETHGQSQNTDIV